MRQKTAQQDKKLAHEYHDFDVPADGSCFLYAEMLWDQDPAASPSSSIVIITIGPPPPARRCALPLLPKGSPERLRKHQRMHSRASESPVHLGAVSFVTYS
eukprot:9769907-Karenia_brevis.AAC.1